MLLFQVLVVVSLVGGFIGGMVWLILRINRYARGRYGRSPISWGRSFLMSLPWIVLLLGYYMDLVSNNNNFAVAIVFAVVVTVSVFWWIAAKTSFWIATATMPILMFLGLGLATIILAVVVVTLAVATKDRKSGNTA
jgi:hypothetical protein